MAPEQRPLTSWKEIANYLGKGVRTVQRWERELGLPVRRPSEAEKHVVIALPSELTDWLHTRMRQGTSQPDGHSPVAGRRSLSPAMARMRETCHVVLQRSEDLYRRSAEIFALSEQLLKRRSKGGLAVRDLSEQA